MPRTTPPQQQMALLARRFLDTLGDQREQVLLPFTHRNRFDWHYIPRSRAGLHLRDMNEAQRRSLDALDQQRQRTVIASESPGDIVTGPVRHESLERPAGVPLGELDGTLKSQAERLIDTYLDNLRADFASARRRRLQEAGLDSVHFAWAGSREPGRPHYYRLHGPRLLIEYDNTQDNANHIHAVCRDPQNDFGMDWLAEHYRSGHSRD